MLQAPRDAGTSSFASTGHIGKHIDPLDGRWPENWHIPAGGHTRHREKKVIPVFLDFFPGQPEGKGATAGP